jgi:hypothetical protein
LTKATAVLARWTVHGIRATIVIDGLLIVSQLLFAHLLRLEESGGSVSETMIAIRRAGDTWLNVASTLVAVLTAVAFLIWVYRTTENARSLNRGRLEFSPSWAVAAFLIPILNLVAPHRIALELWRASGPESEAAAPAPHAVRWWWPVAVLTQIGGYVAYRNSPLEEDPYHAWYAYVGLSIIVSLIGIIWSCLWIWLVRRITERQAAQALIARSAAVSPAAEPGVAADAKPE